MKPCKACAKRSDKDSKYRYSAIFRICAVHAQGKIGTRKVGRREGKKRNAGGQSYLRLGVAEHLVATRRLSNASSHAKVRILLSRSGYSLC